VKLAEVVVELVAKEFVVLHVEVELVAKNGELSAAFLNARLKSCFVKRGMILYDSCSVEKESFRVRMSGFVACG
jgi:hypothetical protein